VVFQYYSNATAATVSLEDVSASVDREVCADSLRMWNPDPLSQNHDISKLLETAESLQRLHRSETS